MPRNDFINTDGTINYDNIPSTSQVANISIKQYGAKGDGTTDDYLAFNRLISSIGSSNAEVYLPSGTYIIGTNLTIPSNISFVFANGAMLSPNTSITITINGYIKAPMSQIFGGTGTIGGTFKNKEIFPQWFGAKGDGINDDTIAIQNTINIASGKNITFIPNIGSTYLVSNSITVPSNTHLIIEGTIKLANNINKSVLSINAGANNVFIEGTGIIDGNKANQSVAPSGGIVTPNGSRASNITIINLTIQNCYNWPVNFVDVNDVKIYNVTMLNGGNSAEFAGTSTGSTYRCIIQDCIITSINSDFGFAFYGGVSNSAIKDCYVYNNQSGITVYSDTGQPNPCQNILISGCYVYNNQRIGIDIAQTVTLVHKGISIIGCDIFGNNISNLAGTAGADILLNLVTDCIIEGNRIHESGNGLNGATGIYLFNTTRCRINSNKIYNEGVGSTASGAGIVATANSIDCQITNNDFHDNQGTPTMKYGINQSAASLNVSVIGNRFGTGVTTSIANIGALGGIVANNPGCNPIGFISALAPAIPASNIAYTNGFGVTCRVFIYGGTVTAIAINGTTTGIINGMVELSVGDTITLTYSVAPSWTWFGL